MSTDLPPIEPGRAPAASPHGRRPVDPGEALRELLERVAGLGSWRWTIATGDLQWSPAACVLMGLEPGCAPPKAGRAGRLLVADSWRRLRRAVVATLRGRAPFEVELQHRRADGGTGWVEARGELLRDAQGRPAALIGTLADIGDRRALDHALRTSEARLRAIFESAYEAMIVTDPTLTIVMANAAAAQMHRCALGELLGTPFHRWIPQRHHQAFADEMRRVGGQAVASVRRGQRDGLTALRADGQEFPIEVTLSRLWVDGQHFYAAVGRDLTEPLRVQRELEQSRNDLRKLISRTQSIEEKERRRIALDLHDELQQPLAAMKMDALSLAAQTRSATLAQRAAGLAATADRAIAATRRIVNDLRPPMLDDLGLGSALQLMAAQFAQRSGLRCDCEALGAGGAAAPDLADLGDAGLRTEVVNCLFRVAQESLNNIHKHAAARHVRLSLDLRDPGAVVLHISDDGKGIRPQDLRRPEALGLLGMDERLRAFGGSLQVRARPEGGTLVEARVPHPEPPA